MWDVPHSHSDLQNVSIRDEQTGAVEVLDVTDTHPFFVLGSGWTNAADLAVGEQLDAPNGHKMTVVENDDNKRPEGITVYNFTVDGDHTYFVGAGGANDEFVWVHNSCTPPPPIGGTPDYPEFNNFNDAQANALAWLRERGFDTGTITNGKFGDMKGIPNGMVGPGKIGYRVEWDPTNGAHINVYAGKLKGPHFKFPGNANTVLATLRQLFGS